MTLLKLRRRLERLDKEELVEALHLYLTKKNSAIEHYDFDVGYWTSEDKKILENLCLVELREMLYALMVVLPRATDALCSADCPFCLYYRDNCMVCPYGKVKGICREDRSVYKKLVRMTKEAGDRVKDDLRLYVRAEELHWINVFMMYLGKED